MHRFLPRALPPGLEALTELALDLRWSWSHASDVLWRTLDADLWERTRNPWAILQNASQRSLEALANDAAFRDELARVTEEHRQYLRGPGWCAKAHHEIALESVAYFSMEFGLSEALPLYAGGLGILSGDHLKTASDLAVPVVGVGLLYQEGYFRQLIDASGRQHETYPFNDPTSLPIQAVTGPNGNWLRIELDLPGRPLYLRVWQVNVGRVRLYLLDSNDLSNSAADRGITAKLYGGGGEIRLLQEIVLGIGGWAALDNLGIEAAVCHLNEGHAAFAALERARRFMKATDTSFREALWATRAGNLFTTHTPVAAGFDAFSSEIMRKYFRDYAVGLDIALDDLLALGRKNPSDDTEPFNMAYLALRCCARANAVSRLHGEVSRGLFEDLYPGWPVGEVPVGHVTNGVHVPSWDSLWADRLWTDACGKARWRGAAEDIDDAIAAIDDESLWALAAQQRRDLIRYVRERLARQLGQRGMPPETVEAAAHVLDPDVLTLGFARRFAEYKRPNLLLRDPERLARLLSNAKRPVQIIVAGKAHPEDEIGKRLIEAWLAFANRPEMRARVVFLEDYDMALAQEMVRGVDLWINTPRRPWEACGTSGMKVLANGGLNLSTLDGWWAEAYAPDVGWAIDPSGQSGGDPDGADAAELYRILEEEAVPLFYDRAADDIPIAWVARKRASISRLALSFSSNRMLTDYVEGFYSPCAMEFRRRSDDGARLARELNAWQTRLAAGWHDVRFGEKNVQRQGDEWRFEVTVYLGDLSPESVKVELYADPAPHQEPVHQTMVRDDSITGGANTYVYRACVSASRPDWHFTPRVIAWHAEAHIPGESGLVSWQR
jgi:starch phosphorylase